MNGRLEHLRGSALGSRNLTHYIARSLLETGGFRPNYTADCEEPLFLIPWKHHGADTGRIHKKTLTPQAKHPLVIATPVADIAMEALQHGEPPRPPRRCR
jgi:hypothetical protein